MKNQDTSASRMLKKRKPKSKKDQSESMIQSGCIALLNRSKILTNRVNSGSFKAGTRAVRCNSMNGKSDIEAWVALRHNTNKDVSIGICLYIEFKTRLGKQKQSQKIFEELISRTNQKYLIVRSQEDLITQLKKLKVDFKEILPDFTLDIGLIDRMKDVK